MPSSSIWRSGPSRRAMPARTLADDDGVAGDCDWAMATSKLCWDGKAGNLTEVGGRHNAPQAAGATTAAPEVPDSPCIESARHPSDRARRRNAMISHHDALIYTMVLVSAADNNMPDVELTSIGDAVLHLPVFRDFDRQKLPAVTNEC